MVWNCIVRARKKNVYATVESQSKLDGEKMKWYKFSLSFPILKKQKISPLCITTATQHHS